jgi:hypothetical protein
MGMFHMWAGKARKNATAKDAKRAKKRGEKTQFLSGGWQGQFSP